MAESGAPRLALRIMDGDQPAPALDIETWVRWERERIRVYEAAEDWAALVARLEQFPPNVPHDFRRWANTRLSEAYLALGRAPEARQLLLELIWDPEASPVAVREWRRLVIESYLREDAVDDAERAVLRYQQDYGIEGGGERLLRARILLRADRTHEAATLLAGHAEDPEAGGLYLLAQLRSERREPRRVLQAGLRQMRGDWMNPELSGRLWAVVAEAAEAAGDYPTWVNALEHVVAEPSGAVLGDPLFSMNQDTLWSAYLKHAAAVGNEAQFLVGDDRPWFEAAHEAAEGNAVRTRSLYAFLVHRGHDPAMREQALQAFLASLAQRADGEVLLQRLFLDSRHYPRLEAIPLSARHRLVDAALARSDIELASRLMATMRDAPAGADRFMWQLRRARILIMGGQDEAGAWTLRELLKAQEVFGRDDLDRLLQVVFDLQTVGAHEAALALFPGVFARSEDPQLQREVLYWMAESHAATGRPERAAQLYLRSALHASERGLDPWGQTARYQAAQALASAGLFEDARRLYEQLLRVTDDASRRAVLKRELQRLWLRAQEPPSRDMHMDVVGTAGAP